MHREQREQTMALLDAQGISCALFAHLDNVKWLTGFAPPVQLGLHHFSGAPSFIWYADKHFYLIVLDGHVELAEGFAADPDATVIGYEGYSIQHPIHSDQTMAAAWREVIQKTLPASGKIAYEAQHTTALMMNVLQDELSANHNLIPIDKMLVPARMIKTAEELEKLRENFRLTDIGHVAARQSVAVGKREIDIWTDVQAAINQAAGMRVPLGNDLVFGSRGANNIGGFPLDHVMQPNDTVTVDLSTVYKGYWSDSCATYYPNERTAAQAKVHQVVTEALDYAISLIRPGVVAKDVDAKVRAFIEQAGYPVYPHHTGHGVGTSPHEEPRIVPYNEVVLQAGMVIMLEPGIYFPHELSVRLEDGMLITDDGVEILTSHDKS